MLGMAVWVGAWDGGLGGCLGWRAALPRSGGLSPVPPHCGGLTPPRPPKGIVGWVHYLGLIQVLDGLFFVSFGGGMGDATVPCWGV